MIHLEHDVVNILAIKLLGDLNGLIGHGGFKHETHKLQV